VASVAVLVASAARPQPAVAQAGEPRPVRPDAAVAEPITWTGPGALVTIGSMAEDRARLDQLVGRDSTRGFLLRAPSTMMGPPPARAGSLTAVPLLPELLVVRNSDIPTADNDGALWAGRGANVLIRGGLAARAGRVTLVLAPELAYARNLGFASTPAFLSGQQPGTGPFAAQWFTGPYSADLPIRFGDQSYTVFGLGQSSLTVAAGPVAVGLATENQWWGPGVRNALLVSNAAEGAPHLFVRTARPLRTRVGDVEARWILAGLTPSLYFTTVGYPEGTRGGRVLNGAAATLRPAVAPELTLGIARLVLSPAPDGGVGLGHSLDVLTRNDGLGSGPALQTGRRSDQLTSLFARWVLPDAGAEFYGEFARLELPRSLRDFLEAPLNTGAYTFGLARAWRAGRAPQAGLWRASAEVTNLEQSRTFTDRPPPPDFYTGRAAPRGFTSRGQPLGAAVGPGSQSQWAALDYVAPRWQAGLFAQRVRHQNDALYRVDVANAYRHDVSLAGGARAGARYRGVDARATLTVTERLNYLFQNGTFNFLGIGSVDVRNLTLGVSVSPAPRAARAPQPPAR
jgi:hypothetical protein